MLTPSVSVLIDTFNHERFIEEAITSVLGQDFPASGREILVVDDGSTDKTPKILQRFEPLIRILRKENGGQASAFNVGIPQCQGDIVAFLDGDDWWARDKLTRVVRAMAADPALGIVGHGIVNVQLDGRHKLETLREGFRFQANTIEGAHMLRRRGAFLGTSRMTVRSDLLRQIGPIPEEIKIQADEYLFTLATAIAGAQILPEPLTYYRLHSANLFQISSPDPQKMAAKQKALQALADSLAVRLEVAGIEPRVRRAVVEYPQACADQLRLVLRGGWPWETARTEWQLYRIVHPDASISHQVFKFLVLSGALLLPPRSFYGAQRALTRNKFYWRARQRYLPSPEMRHIRKD
jgi:glycosyltransferase involved in cell wall biosynthesis